MLAHGQAPYRPERHVPAEKGNQQTNATDSAVWLTIHVPDHLSLEFHCLQVALLCLWHAWENVYMKRALPQYAVYVAQVPGSSADKNYTSTHAALSVGSHAKTRYYSTLQETREETNGDDDTATTRPRWSVAIDRESLMVVLSAPVRPRHSSLRCQTKPSGRKTYTRRHHGPRSDKAPRVQD